jgi:tetratricopeptide (TPR) repeat protein
MTVLTREPERSAMLRTLGKRAGASAGDVDDVRLGSTLHCVRLPLPSASSSWSSSSSLSQSNHAPGSASAAALGSVSTPAPPVASKQDRALLDGSRGRSPLAVLASAALTAVETEAESGAGAALPLYESLHQRAVDLSKTARSEPVLAYLFFACNRAGAACHALELSDDARMWHRRHLVARDAVDKCVALCNLGLGLGAGRECREVLDRCVAMFDPAHPDYAGFASGDAPQHALRAGVLAHLRLARRSDFARDHDVAESFLLRALSLAERITSAPAVRARYVAVAAWDLAAHFALPKARTGPEGEAEKAIKEQQEEDPRADDYFDLAISLVPALDGASAAVTRGEALTLQARYDLAIEHFEHARDIAAAGSRATSDVDLLARLTAASRRAMCGIGVARAQISLARR